MSFPSSPSGRCTFTFRDGRRCTMLCAPNKLALCPHHIRQWLRGEGRIPPQLTPYIGPRELDNPWAVRRSIKRIFALTQEGKLDPARARVLANLARMLLTSTRRMKRERRAGNIEPPEWPNFASERDPGKESRSARAVWHFQCLHGLKRDGLPRTRATTRPRSAEALLPPPP